MAQANQRVPSPVDVVRCRKEEDKMDVALSAKGDHDEPSFSSTSNNSGAGHPLPQLISKTPTGESSTTVHPIAPANSPAFPTVPSNHPSSAITDQKWNAISPSTDNFRSVEQEQQKQSDSNIWHFQAASKDTGDGEFFTEGFTTWDNSMSLENRTTMDDDQESGREESGQKKRSDKTPMCIIAELARYNAVPHQYKLINEEGPAHQKLFTVSLIISEGEKKEEYTAQGASIKKAQQAAAQLALDETKLPKKPAQFNHKRRPTARTFGYSLPENVSITPTVMLNALAMKWGVKPDFTFLNTPYPVFPTMPTMPPPFAVGYVPRAYHGNAPYMRPPPMPPYGLLRYPPAFPFAPFPPFMSHYVNLKIGDYEFVGQGPNRQLAKHDAAVKAMKILEPIMQRRQDQVKEKPAAGGQDGDKSKMDKDDGTSMEIKSKTNTEGDASYAEDPDQLNGGKSAINLVFEFALKRHMDVNFEVVSESGPAHKRQFVMRCVVTFSSSIRYTTEGEGASKKLAKHNAAEKMMEKLKESSEQLPQANISRQSSVTEPKLGKDKKRKPTIIKDMKSDPNYGLEINPVSRLIQVQQAKHEPEPVFEFLKEEGHARCKEFVMKVTIGERSCEGRGPNKKLAKRAAAETMLESMGYAKPLPKPGKPVLKHRQSPPPCESPENVINPTVDEKSNQSSDSISQQDSQSTSTEKPRKVKFQFSDDELAKLDREDSGRGDGRNRSRFGRRIAPGLFFLPFAFDDCDLADKTESKSDQQQTGENGTVVGSEAPFGTWNADVQCAIPQTDPSQTTAEGAKDHLEYLANLLSFQVQFTDFPKSSRDGENGEYLSLVSLPTNPALVCHGSGATVQQAQNEAALAALRNLAGKGLDSTSVMESSKNLAGKGLDSTSVMESSKKEDTEDSIGAAVTVRPCPSGGKENGQE